MTVDMTPVRSPSRSKMPRARSRTCATSTKSGPTGDAMISSSKPAPAATAASMSFARPDRTSPANHARPRAKSIIPISRRAAARLRSSPSSLRELDGATIGLLGGVEVDLDRDRAERLADRAPKERLTQLERRPELRGAVAALGGADPGATRQLRCGVLVVAHSQRRRTPELHVELEGRIAHRLGEGRQLGQAVEPVGGPAQDGERIVAGREEDPTVGRRRHDRKRLLDEPERLLGGVRGEGGRRRIDGEAGGPHGVTRGERVLGEHRQAGRGRVAAVQQQVDDRGVDLAAPGRRQLACGELADLLVGEGVIGRLALGMREQEAHPDGRRRARRRAGRHRHLGPRPPPEGPAP